MSGLTISITHPEWDPPLPREEVLKAVEFFKLIRDPSSKIYFGQRREHSIRFISESSFALQVDRKNPKEALEGTFKKAVPGWEVVIRSVNELFVSHQMIIKEKGDLSSHKRPGQFKEILDRELRIKICSLPYIQHVKENCYRTKKRYFKQFYVTEKALCNGLQIATDVPCTFDGFLILCLQFLSGVESLHTEGLVHNDLSPSNLLIFIDHETGMYHLKIADLDTLQELGKIKGFSTQTSHYLSPPHRYFVHKAFESIYKRKARSPQELEAGYAIHRNLRKFTSDLDSERASAGFVIAELYFGMMKKRRMPPEITPDLWLIVRDLTGGYMPSPSTTNMIEFLTEVDLALFEGRPTTSPIPLKKAISQFTALLSSSRERRSSCIIA
jgi:serine/threonine protein kinase